MAQPFDLIIRGGTVVDASGARRADVAINGTTIAAVGEELGPAARTLDAEGCLVVPGLVDIQVHFRTPGATDSETLASGASGAALGGMTACVLMPNTTPCVDNVELVRELRAAAAGLPCDLHPSAAVTVDRASEQLVDFGALYEAGVRVFTDDGWAVSDAALMRGALEATVGLPGAVISQHAEEPTLVEGGVVNEGALSRRLGLAGRPSAAEDIIVARDLALARLTGGRYHVLHMSSAGALELVRAAKAEGVRVTCEVTPQHLILTEDDVERLGTSGKMNPPLRTSLDVAALRGGLADGTIDAIATDHAPHHPDLKAQPIETAPPGMLGVETAAAVVFGELVPAGVITVEQAVALLSTRPAEIAGLTEHGRPIAAGSPANLAIIDPAHRWTVHGDALASRSNNTPWEGREFSARVRHTVLRGNPVVTEFELTD